MKLITTETLHQWLDQLAVSGVLIAPHLVDGILLYRPVASSEEISFDYTRPKLSAKEVVFPPTEHLFSIAKQGKEVSINETTSDKSFFVFGLRPCDAHGIHILDAVFIDKEPQDAAYARRRAATTLIGLACPAMWEGCFCTGMGGAPDDPSHLDVLLTAVENGFTLQSGTEKGEALLKDLELQEYPGILGKLAKENTVTPNKINWPKRFTNNYWNLLAERCIGCRICAYVCPTCRCFDVRDEVVERHANAVIYDRLRCWDSCTGPNYRVTAGGHNSRPTKGSRLRNRFYCKFAYLSASYGPDGCVGCGRCVEACPVNVDIVEVLHDLEKMEAEV